MFQKILLLIMISTGFAGCSGGENQSKGEDSSEVARPSDVQEDVAADPDPSDTIPATDYVQHTTNAATAARLKAALPVILKKELMGADSSARRFVFYETDLNDDGKNEVLVGFTGMNWCGSGGCTALLLSSDGDLITHFTVAGFPFTVLDEKTQGWKNLSVYSGGADRLLKWDGKSYPKNPSVAPKFTGKLSGDSPKALAFATEPYPWFTF
jgi:hypothetical protein